MRRLIAPAALLILGSWLLGAEPDTVAPSLQPDPDSIRIFRWRAAAQAPVIKEAAESVGLEEQPRAQILKIVNEHLGVVEAEIEQMKKSPRISPVEVMARAEKSAAAFEQDALPKWAAANGEAMKKIQAYAAQTDGIHTALMG
ncbi:MAG TPA: hypothetical protein VH518_11995, partial [Tepidisphaeraceae bacterium]